MSSDRIPLSQPWIDEADIREVTEALRSPRLSLGERTEAFEGLFAETVGARYAVAVSSGTAALHLAVIALDWKAGQEVVTTPFSFIASANCLLYEGVKPVFADIEEETYGLDPVQVEAAISDRTVGVLPVHVFGRACQADVLSDIARRRSLHMVEDSCEAMLATRAGKMVGQFGKAAAYGFYPNKQMTTGEGGMLTTDDPEVYHLVRSLRNQGRGEDLQHLVHDKLGFNYRISELTAALGFSQTQKLPGLIRKRQELAQVYMEELAEMDEVSFPQVQEHEAHSWFVFHIRVKAALRDQLLRKLNEKGIQSKAYFHPCIHLQPYYQQTFGYRQGQFPVAEKVSREVVALPFFAAMTPDQVRTVKERLAQALLQIKKGV